MVWYGFDKLVGKALRRRNWKRTLVKEGLVNAKNNQYYMTIMSHLAIMLRHALGEEVEHKGISEE